MANEAERAQGEAEFRVRLAGPSDVDVLAAIDDDAAGLYAEYGLRIELPREHPFARAELERWSRAAELGRAFLAVDAAGDGIGFASLELVDGAPYLDQLAVRVSVMRRGIGAALLARSTDWARAVGGTVVWLTTYRHLPFNRAYYERYGYVEVPESGCGPGIRHHLEDQRRHLPLPNERIAMRRDL